jgi:hypothetical protein
VRARAATVAALLALATACHRSMPSGEGQTGQTPAAAAAPVASAAPPADHLGPDELVEGSQQAFGIALPRALQIKGAFVDVVYANGQAAVPALTKYFKARVQDGSLREGARAATFEHVRAPGKPGVELYVHIMAAGDGANVEIRNSTSLVAPSLPDEAARWKEVGLTPHGRIADPTHLE